MLRSLIKGCEASYYLSVQKRLHETLLLLLLYLASSDWYGDQPQPHACGLQEAFSRMEADQVRHGPPPGQPPGITTNNSSSLGGQQQSAYATTTQQGSGIWIICVQSVFANRHRLSRITIFSFCKCTIKDAARCKLAKKFLELRNFARAL